MPRWEVEPDDEAVERYLGRLALPVRVVARELDALARSELRGGLVGIKWGVPFYALRGPVCYVSAAKAHVTFGLLQGVHVEDASGLLVGTTKSPIRKAVFEAGEKVPKGAVRGWLRQARRLDATWGAR